MIYLLEDDDSIRELIIYTLNSLNIKTTGFAKPSEFWQALQKEKPSLLLLDIMLPEEDGLSILKKIRNDSSIRRLPVIMLTAKGSEYDKVVGLDCGADDYITKPFGMMEFVSRVKAMLRRTEIYEENDKDYVEYNIGRLYVCPTKHIVKIADEEISLTVKEFELLSLLIENKSVVFSRGQLLNRIWGYDFNGENRTVDVHIGTLRQKLKECGDYIETVRGYGYKFIGEEKNDKKNI